jgi:hypothetical protein
MPFGQKKTPTDKKEEGGGGAIVAVIGIAAVLAALLGLAAAAKTTPPGGKKKTHISSLVGTWIDEGSAGIRYYWDGYLQDDSNVGVNGKTIKLQLMFQGSTSWVTIDTQTTRIRGPGNEGYFFFYKLYAKPIAQKVRIIFDGDAEYEGCNLWYNTIDVF